MSSDYEAIRCEHIEEYGKATKHLELLKLLYTERTHFIFELLQNAEDAHATAVSFTLTPDRLVVCHDGRSFNERDVRGICGVADSGKDELTAIGRFGIGFKSVYAYTTAPEVHSGDEHFRVRDYVRPEYAPWSGEDLSDRTVFVLPFDRDDIPSAQAYQEIRDGLLNLNVVTLLFLRQLIGISVAVDGEGIRLERISGADHRSVELLRYRNGKITDHPYWWVFRRELDHLGLPGKRVEIAFKLTGAGAEAKVEPLPQSPLVAYFPTEKLTNLGFLLQAPLRTTPARDNVPEHDQDNIRLINEAAALLVEAVELLRDERRLDLEVFRSLPINADLFPEQSMLRPLFDALREALRSRRLLPSADGGYVAADELRLARTSAVRDLLTPQQLAILSGASRPLSWPTEQLTDRHPLWNFLVDEMGVEEIRPEWLVNQLDEKFLQSTDDEWLIRFYALLDDNPRLWDKPLHSRLRPGPARNLPLIRLEDGSHTPPFGPDGTANAYLPAPGHAPSRFPTVRRTIADDPRARSFLEKLGLAVPDIVDEVTTMVLPRYAEGTVEVDSEDHEGDLQRIQRALEDTPDRRAADLVQQLSQTPFLRANNEHHPAYVFRTPAECYWHDDELRHYFAPWPHAWFVDPAYGQAYRDTLIRVGVADRVRVTSREPNQRGHVILRSEHGDHKRGLDGFDPGLQIHGLEAALQHPELNRSAHVWNQLLAPRAERLRGTVGSSGRQEYIDSTLHEKDTEPYRLATSHAWIPTRDGRFARPHDVKLPDLPEELGKHHVLAEVLGLIKTVVEVASKELGLPAHLLQFLKENPEARRELEQSYNSTTSVDEEEQLSEPEPTGPAELDYAAALEDAFSSAAAGSPASGQAAAVDTAGEINVPSMRQERTVAEIESDMENEPAPTERFDLKPRKVWVSKRRGAREFLQEQYAGRCQICETEAFPKRDGTPYFEAHYLVPHTAAAWIGRPGNVLSLCANCLARLQHGHVHADDLLEQIRSWKALAEGGVGDNTLRLSLSGLPTGITYTEKHLFDLREMVNLGRLTTGSGADPDAPAGLPTEPEFRSD